MALDLLEKNARLVKMEDDDESDTGKPEEETENLDDKEGGEEEM